MIIKSYQLQNININTNKFILFYGINEGLKKEEILKLILSENKENINKFEEKEILDNTDNFLNSILSKSLFEDKKIIIINRVSEKILDLIKEIIKKNISDISIILSSNNLENKCNGDRGILNNELEKIKSYTLGGKSITTDKIIKLINLVENHSITELIDNCLAKNYKRTLTILNENNFSKEDAISIIKIFILKLKKLLKLVNDYNLNRSLSETIDNAKPPIFWKDKEIIKQQITLWT